MNADIMNFPMLIFAAGLLLGGIAVIPSIWSARFARLALHRRAARTMGASGWRIFWRITLPEAWLQILLGALLATASAALIYLAAA
jgi:ABC-type spermidine/putrescine transport system permease subunit II